MLKTFKNSVILSLFSLLTLLVCCASSLLAADNPTDKAAAQVHAPNAQQTPMHSNPHAAQPQRRFSYRPVAFQAGDRVEVSTADTNVMRGADTVGTLKQGESFQITKVNGQWLGISTDHHGQKMNGWVFGGHVMAVGHAQQGTSVNPPAAPQGQRRAFSYQPVPQYYGGGNYYYSSPHKEPWQYPKTDPRRYRIHNP